MSKRRLSDWISAYLEYVDNTEPPLSYHTWVGISTIASSLRRRVFIKWGYDIIYPNMFIVLVGSSGRCRKGTAMRLGYNLLKEVKIKIAAESITREALIRRMKNSIDTYIDPDTKKLKTHSSLAVVSEELSVFLGQNNVKFLADLTNLYDCQDEWTYETKLSGTDSVQGVCLNILGGTAPDWLTSILPQEAIGGGFTSRIIFVVEENKRKTVSGDQQDPQAIILKKALIEDLERISMLAGQFEFSPDAHDMYTSWYEEQDAMMKTGDFPISDPRLAGYCDRRQTHLRKLCMVFSASRGDDMVIMPSDFERSLNVLETAEVKMPRVFAGIGQAKFVQSTEKILAMIAARGQVTRGEVMLQFFRDVDAETMDLIERTLEAMQVIRKKVDTMNNEITYIYIKPKK